MSKTLLDYFIQKPEPMFPPELLHKPKRTSKTQSTGELLDIRQAAAVLQVSMKWLYRSYQSLPHVLIPAGKKPRIRFRRAALEQWIANHEIDFRKGRAR
jgi:predicted DNA-binding transcriptional regulator AlpA